MGGNNGVLSTRIGYATSLFDTSLISQIDDLNENFPNHYVLLQNYPNPFNPSTTIEYEIAKTTDVGLIIFNLLGQKVATLVNERQNAGRHQVQWQAADFASGIYYYQLRSSDGFIQTKKLILLR